MCHARPPVFRTTLHDRNGLLHFVEKETEVGEPDLHRSPKLLFFPLHPATSLILVSVPSMAFGLV